jgi:hypothetical protein
VCRCPSSLVELAHSPFIAFIFSPGTPSFFTLQNSLFPIFSGRGLTKIRTYALISGVRHGATVKGRIRAAASSAGAGGKLSWVRVAPFRGDFTADGTDGTDGVNAECRMQNEEFLSVKSVKSAVKFLWLRLAALCLLSLFAAIIPNCLSMNRLHTTTSFFGQAQSRLIKPNQVIFARQTGTVEAH